MVHFKFVDETGNSPAVSLDAVLVVVLPGALQIGSTKAVPKASPQTVSSTQFGADFRNTFVPQTDFCWKDEVENGNSMA
jgi:hypothetical protein